MNTASLLHVPLRCARVKVTLVLLVWKYGLMSTFRARAKGHAVKVRCGRLYLGLS